MAAPDRSHQRHRAVTALLAAAVLVVAGAAVTALLLLRTERASLVETARELAVDSPELLHTIEHSGDGQRARLALARTLLATELGPRAAGDPELADDRLETARALAAAVLAARPASWRAATVTGTATYLAWARKRDPRLLQEYHLWEEPLLLARRLAPDRDEPVRALVGAYLELWPALSATKRDLARELAARAFRDQATFDRLIEPWLAIAGTGPDALAAIPDQPWAWRRLATALAGRNDWPGFCTAQDQARDTLEKDLLRQLTEGRRLADRGEILAARSKLFGLVAEAPTDLRFARIVDLALRAIPPGPAGRDVASALRTWLRWQLDSGAGRHLDENPTATANGAGRTAGASGLSFAAIARLRSAAFPGGAVGANLPLAARAALATPGDGSDPIVRANRIERQAQALWSPEWGRYFIDKARILTAEDRLAEARETLDRVHPSWRDHPLYWLALGEWSERSDPGRNRKEGAASRKALEHLAARSWPGTDWSWNGPVAELLALVAAPSRVTASSDGAVSAGRLEIEIADAPPAGAAVEVSVDGAGTGCRVARTGGTLTVPVPIAPGLHHITLKTLAAGQVWPGRVRLRSSSGDE